MRLRIDPGAEEEAGEAARWYERQREGLGVEFLGAVDVALGRIQADPHACPRVETLADEPNVRRLLMRRFPYAIIFEIVSDEVRYSRCRAYAPAAQLLARSVEGHRTLSTPLKPNTVQRATNVAEFARIQAVEEENRRLDSCESSYQPTLY